MEVFKPIVGYEKYQISNKGNVYSENRKRLLVPKKSKTGYLRITLCNKNGHRTFLIHRLVAMAFIENLEGKPTVNHKNEIKTDNRAENLEWATNAEQNAYGTRTQRAMAHTDWTKRTKKMDYQEIAKKHDYNRHDMCGRKQTRVYKNGILVGVFLSQADAAASIGISKGRLSTCKKEQLTTKEGFSFR